MNGLPLPPGRPLVLVLALAAAIGLSRPAVAQGVFELHPSLSLAQLYDSNLFSTASDRQSDFITRLTPAVATTYRTVPLVLSGRYTADLERFVNHPELTRPDARQQGTAGLAYRPTPRLSLAADLEVTRTRTPGDLSLETGLAVPRSRASRTAARAALTRQIAPRSEGVVEYAFREDDIERGLTVRNHAAAVKARHRLSPRLSMGVDYRVAQHLFGPSAGLPVSSVVSHTLSAGWRRAMTPRVSLALGAGPRLTDGSLAPELSASVQYLGAAADLSLSYGRTQTTVIGVAAPVDTEHVTGAAAWAFTRDVTVRLAPAFFHSRVAGMRANVYRLAIDLVRPFSRHLALAVTFDATIQRGHLQQVRDVASIVRRTALVSLVAARSGSSR
jgi:hypothetical protein